MHLIKQIILTAFVLLSIQAVAQKGGHSNSSTTSYKLIAKEQTGSQGQAIQQSIDNEKFIFIKLLSKNTAEVYSKDNGKYNASYSKKGNQYTLNLFRNISGQSNQSITTLKFKQYGNKLILKKTNSTRLIYEQTTSKMLGTAKDDITQNSYFIRSVANSDLYVDIPGYYPDVNSENGTKVQLWAFEDLPDRKVKFIPVNGEPGWYYIELNYGKGARYFDINGVWSKDKYIFKSQVTSKKDNGARVQLWDLSRNEVQKYRIKSVSGHPDRVFIEVQYTGKVLDASKGGIHSNGCKLQQWDFHGGTNQQWQLINSETGQPYRK